MFQTELPTARLTWKLKLIDHFLNGIQLDAKWTKIPFIE
jgi:hypothetical protein